SVLFRSFWGTFGWMTLRMPEWVYAAALMLTIGAAAGLAVMRRDEVTRRLHLLFGAAVAMQVGQVVVYNLTFTQAQGRFLFPVLGPIAVLLVAGLSETARLLRAPAIGDKGAAVLTGLMAAANLLILRLVVQAAY
ncbi:MAG TPA: hypothetical protein VFP98_03195, partial [Candidatus Polarisedimenticolia bacterium]|nr:hypothetical protein [Candidatus Polarisedimenticolia bacterium]